MDDRKSFKERQQERIRAMQEKTRTKQVAALAPVLISGEHVVDLTSGQAAVIRMGSKTYRRATIALTDRRVIIFTKKLGGHDLADFAYGLLTGVEHKRGLMYGELTIRASGDAAHIKQVPKDDVMRISQGIRDHLALSRPSNQAQPVGEGSNELQNYAQLEKLADLRKKGIITPAEYDAKKKQLLGL